jgi:hypothetical protein
VNASSGTRDPVVEAQLWQASGGLAKRKTGREAITIHVPACQCWRSPFFGSTWTASGEPQTKTGSQNPITGFLVNREKFTNSPKASAKRRFAVVMVD